MSDAPISRAECDTCDWVLTREDVIEHLPGDPRESRIREKFGSLREGHAYFNRGHSPNYIREGGEVDE